MKHLTKEQIKKQRIRNAIAQFLISLFMCAIGALGFCYVVEKQPGDEWGFVAVIATCLILIVTGVIVALDALDYLLSKEI